MDYFITLIGHICENKRPDGFPQKVEASIEVEAENPQELIVKTNMIASKVIHSGGLIVPNPRWKGQEIPGTTPETHGFDQNVFIPLHMISYFETATTIKPVQDAGGTQPEEEVIKLQ